eukprot:63231_1
MNTTLDGSRSISSFNTLNIYVRSNFEKLCDEKFCDVTFKVGEQGKEYHALRALFAIHSRVFETMLYGSMIESSLDSIELQDIKPNTFEFLRLFCYGLDPVLNAKNVVGILQCSDKYLIEPLKKACIQYISSINITSDGNSSDFLKLLIQLNHYNLTDKIVEIIDKVKIRCNFDSNFINDDDDNDNDNDDYKAINIEFEEILNNPLLLHLNKH